MNKTPRLLSRIAADRSVLFLCDMQEKFSSTIHKFDAVVSNARRLHDAAHVMAMPMVVTEQYPKGLGHTVPELGVDTTKVDVHEKTCFSMWLPDVQKRLSTLKRDQVITMLPHDVRLVGRRLRGARCRRRRQQSIADGTVGRRVIVGLRWIYRMYAPRQMEKAGATLTTSECAILSLVRDAKHKNFKEIQKIILTSAAETDLIK